ncbi:MAG: transporter substrate-binding domain-containing protein, partial [Clostridia bacterium]|nr:transporter substrate-binding domain-containing protein [Clostridia bacterium]
EAQLAYYNGKADLVAALTGNKVDAFVVDEPVAQILMREDDRLASLPDYLEKYEFAFVFPKNEAGEALRKQYNAFLEKLGKEKLEALEQKWFGEDENAKTMPDPASLPAPNGTLRLATESGYAPFEYVRDGQVVGYDMEIAALFCEDSGYGLEIVDMNFDAVLPAVQTGKCDFAAAGISFTPERAESVSFSDPNYTGGTVLVTLKTQAAAFQEETPTEKKPEGSFWSSLSSSFEKTFLRESRWKLFLEGIGTTLLITVLSILFGTALGFLVFMLCRNGNPLANKIIGFSVWLVSGTPMVVLMMILYYLVFGSVAISGITVAVIGFTLTFGAAVLGLLRMGVGTVDRGQYEAAYALGHSSRHTFFRIILPQAIPHVLPAYQAEIVGLIKSTAIVGYIAVQDLTKMGDIVRSRTYEAFFPLIAITVIYFLLEGLFSIAVSRIRISIDPKKRKREKILKGVNVHDQD